MSDNTSLYTSGNVANVTIPANNNTSLYNGTGNAIPYSDDINVQGNITAGGYISAVGGLYTDGQISAAGNIITDGYFIGSFAGNIAGNLVVPGSNTAVLYNANGIAGASNGLKFDYAGNVLSSAGNIVAAGNISATYYAGHGRNLTGIVSSYGNSNVVTL